MFIPVSTFYLFMKGILKLFLNTSDLPVYTCVNILPIYERYTKAVYKYL